MSANVTPQQPVALKPLPEKEPVPTKSADPPIPGLQRRVPGAGGGSANSSTEDFRPTLKVKDDLDVSSIDPRIQLDLLAKLRAVPLEGGSSSLFEFGKPPEPPAPPVAAIVPKPPVTPPPASTATDLNKKPPAPPPPPPIPFKFYGYAGKTADGQLEGLFREGEDATGEIYHKREGDTIKDRYKIIRIGLRSAVVEDTVSHNQQTLPLLEEQQ